MDKVTAHCRDTARKTFVIGTPRTKIPILIPGYETEHEPPSPEERRRMRQAAGIADDEILLLNAARLAPEKAQDQLLQTFRVVADYSAKARLWICGVGLKSIETQLYDMRKQLGLESVVQLVGFKDDYWNTLAMADMMVHPAHVEGMPLALLGAMAAGLPIVASAVGGVPEIIEHGKTGMLAAENDVEGFTRCVLELLKDPPRARGLGRAARDCVRTELSIGQAVRKVENIYREMLAPS
jgi:glycosyltransferase involved in cell wall biosynthesis